MCSIYLIKIFYLKGSSILPNNVGTSWEMAAFLLVSYYGNIPSQLCPLPWRSYPTMLKFISK